jgi:NADH-quinone oxidoreductase subunit L
MVTAGVFLCAALSPLMEYAPTRSTRHLRRRLAPRCSPRRSGCVQNDIKRIIAYST